MKINLSPRHVTSLNQGLSSLAPLGWGVERPWERGCHHNWHLGHFLQLPQLSDFFLKKLAFLVFLQFFVFYSRISWNGDVDDLGLCCLLVNEDNVLLLLLLLLLFVVVVTETYSVLV